MDFVQIFFFFFFFYKKISMSMRNQYSYDDDIYSFHDLKIRADLVLVFHALLAFETRKIMICTYLATDKR